MEKAGRSYLLVVVTDPVLMLSRAERICHPCVLSVSSLHLKENWKNRNHARIFILSAQSASLLRRGIAFPEAGTRKAVWAEPPLPGASQTWPRVKIRRKRVASAWLSRSQGCRLCWRKSRAAFLLFR